MNRTRRGLNRILLILLGTALLAAGTLAAWAGASPETARQWTITARDTVDRIEGQLRATPLPGTDTSWWTVAALLLLLVVISLLVCWILSQGRGRAGDLGAHDENSQGTTTVDVSFAAQAIKAAASENRQLLSTTVSAWRIKDVETLKISLQVRKGASPADIASAMDVIIAGLDTVLGEQIPVLVRIRAGQRTRFAHPERVQ